MAKASVANLKVFPDTEPIMSAIPSPDAVPGRDPRARLKATRRNLFLWTLQAWLAMFFAAAGYAKLREPMENLVGLMRWPASASPDVVHGVGAAEILLALAMLAPASSAAGRAVLRTAAAALAAASAAMLAVHAALGDPALAAVNAVLLPMALAVTVGRR